MKIAILSSASAGGAGIAAHRTYLALKNIDTLDVDFIDIEATGEAVNQDISPQMSATNGKFTNTHFTIDYATEPRSWLVHLLSGYDVINIHWSSYLISLSEILFLARKGNRILFTLHDFYYITGGCHYPAGCLGYLDKCIHCPQLNDTICNQYQIIDSIKLKREIFSHPNVHLCAPSNFIVKSAVASKIISNEQGVVIRNAYAPKDFCVNKKEFSRFSLLLIADSFNEERKGLRLAVESIKLAAQHLNIDHFELHLVGGLDSQVEKMLQNYSIQVYTHGHIKEHEQLISIFRRCNYILSCSYEDNWPNVLVESASYGCIPIVGMWHGCEEFTNLFNVGYNSKSYTPSSFSDAIIHAFSEFKTEETILKTERLIRNVRETHDPQKIAKEYICAFNNIKNNQNTKESLTNNTIIEKRRISDNFLISEHIKLREKEHLVRTPSPFGSQENFSNQKIDKNDLLKYIREKNQKTEFNYGITSFIINESE